MIAGIGTDIVEIHRVRQIIKGQYGHSFVKRVFTDHEKEYCLQAKDPANRYASRFAAKEAVLKALGKGLRGMKWNEIEVIRDDGGRPSIRLTGAAKKLAAAAGITHWFLTISHSREYAVAQVIAWQEGSNHAHP